MSISCSNLSQRSAISSTSSSRSALAHYSGIFPAPRQNSAGQTTYISSVFHRIYSWTSSPYYPESRRLLPRVLLMHLMEIPLLLGPSVFGLTFLSDCISEVPEKLVYEIVQASCCARRYKFYVGEDTRWSYGAHNWIWVYMCPPLKGFVASKASRPQSLSGRTWPSSKKISSRGLVLTATFVLLS